MSDTLSPRPRGHRIKLVLTSALDQKATWRPRPNTAALPSIADIRQRCRNFQTEIRKSEMSNWSQCDRTESPAKKSDIENLRAETSPQTRLATGYALDFPAIETRENSSKRRTCRTFSGRMEKDRRDGTGWLGCLDSNWGMAESKSITLCADHKRCAPEGVRTPEHQIRGLPCGSCVSVAPRHWFRNKHFLLSGTQTIFRQQTTFPTTSRSDSGISSEAWLGLSEMIFTRVGVGERNTCSRLTTAASNASRIT